MGICSVFCLLKYGFNKEFVTIFRFEAGCRALLQNTTCVWDYKICASNVDSLKLMELQDGLHKIQDIRDLTSNPKRWEFATITAIWDVWVGPPSLK